MGIEENVLYTDLPRKSWTVSVAELVDVLGHDVMSFSLGTLSGIKDENKSQTNL